MPKLDIRDKRIIGIIQGYRKVRIEDLAKKEFNGSNKRAKRTLQKLIKLGYVKIIHFNYFKYTGKEIDV